MILSKSKYHYKIVVLFPKPHILNLQHVLFFAGFSSNILFEHIGNKKFIFFSEITKKLIHKIFLQIYRIQFGFR